ncbi:hypothetical protein SIID45300_01129 [Candidatus Magnetaquicoccaceae bacterium FCR-1]|uniref:Uncharacterized protein n=1 Tax=Candidatus Magnetaquiglobus chichijimensis TaxID=3141448 RepID=A0ABQ0C7F6_9PROT
MIAGIRGPQGPRRKFEGGASCNLGKTCHLRLALKQTAPNVGGLKGSLKKNRAHATALSGNTTSTQNPPNASERPNAIRPP